MVKLRKPKRIEFYQKWPMAFISTLLAVFRNKRRSTAMLAGIFLSVVILSGIIIYNDTLKQNNYESVVGQVPFEVRFDVLGNETYDAMQQLQLEIQDDSRVSDTTIVATVNSNNINNWFSSIAFPLRNPDNSIDYETPKELDPFFFDDDFFDGPIGMQLSEMNYQGAKFENLGEKDVIVPSQFANAYGLGIGDAIPIVNFTQIIYGVIDDFNDGYLEGLVIGGMYDAIDEGEFDISEHAFAEENLFMPMRLLHEEASMSNILAGLKETGNYYLAVKIEETEFTVAEPSVLNDEISRFINQVAKLSQFEIRGTNTVYGTIVGWQFFSIFVTVLYVLIAAPVVMLSLYLLNFGLEMSLEERRREIAIKKVQGANSRQIFNELRGESLMILAIGTIAGYFAGMVAAYIIGKATGFMAIDSTIFSFGDLVNFIGWVPAAFWWPTILVSFILVYVINKKGKTFINQQVTEGVSRGELKKEGFIKRHNIDYFMFFVGLAGMTLVVIDLMKLDVTVPLIVEILTSAFSPFFLWFGGSSVGSRLTKAVPIKLEPVYLRLPFLGSVKRIIKSGLKRRGDIDRLAVIIILTLSITSLATIQGNTEEQMAVRGIEWEVGADWQVNFVEGGQYLDNITSIDGIDQAVGVSQTIARSLSQGVILTSFDISTELALMESGSGAIRWQSDNFDKFSPLDALKQLEEEPMGIYIPFVYLFILDTEVGDTIPISIGLRESLTGESVRVEGFKILGTINQLPGGFSSSILMHPIAYNELQAISYGLDKTAFANEELNATKYLIKTNAGDNISQDKINSIHTDFGELNGLISSRSLYEEIREINTTTSGYGVTGLLSLNFLISVAVAIVSAFSFSAILMERRKQEFAILRSIGAQKSHIYKIAFGENSLTMTFATIWGSLLGIGIAYLFNGIFFFISFVVGTSAEAVSRVVVIPWLELGILTVIALAGMILATMMSVRSAANQDLSVATRVI